MTLSELSAEWLIQKAIETAATERRRAVEDQMRSLTGVAENETGTVNTEADGGYKIKITCRMNQKIDGDKLQAIAIENGTFGQLGNLFRWKAEINSKNWKAADETITRPLLGAITTTPARASFAITKGDEK